MSEKSPLYVVIAERDLPTNEAYLNGGAIIWETHTGNASLFEALKRAQAIGNQYGKTWIGEVLVMELEEGEERLESVKEKKGS